MAKPYTKHILGASLAFAAAGAVVLAVLVGLGELATGPAIMAGLALFAVAALFSARPVGRLKRLQLRIEDMVSSGAVPQTEATIE